MPFVVISTYPYDIEEFVYHLDTWWWIKTILPHHNIRKIMKGDILPEAQKGFILFHVQFDKKDTIDEKKSSSCRGCNNIFIMMHRWIIIQKNH